MASAGTLLSDLDSRAPSGNDEDLVQKILSEMNTPSPNNPVVNNNPPPNPGMETARRMISSPNPNTVQPHAMDPATPTAHMIGRDYPTAADFASMMQATGGYAPFAAAPQQPQPQLLAAPKSNWYGDIISQFRQPLLVAIIFFVISLPALNVLIGFYVPALLRPGGDLTTMGLLAKSLLAGSLFWFIQRILVPLMAV
jgi:hypothetical protein